MLDPVFGVSRASAVPTNREVASWLARVLKRLLTRATHGRLVVHLPGGRRIEQSGALAGVEANLTIRRWRALRRLLVGGDIGFAEAYMDDDWSTPDLLALLTWAAENDAALSASSAGFVTTRLWQRLRHHLRTNTRANSRRNIMAHYDLGNEFYSQWLDAGMNYSSGIFADPSQSLESAQAAKLDRIVELLALEGGERVLEIGCGWGALAERLVTCGCTATGLTLSEPQREYAANRLGAMGASYSAADIRLQDYRDVEGQFDRIASIEMLEAVGEAYWPVFFNKLHTSLRPGGTAVLQVITIDHEKYGAYRRRPDFIQKHIFPGGMLPTVAIIRDQVARAGLSLHSVHMFGTSYAATLAAWRERFKCAWPEIARLGFDMRFKRAWEYYLAYCETGFNTRALDVGLYCIAKPDKSGGCP